MIGWRGGPAERLDSGSASERALFSERPVPWACVNSGHEKEPARDLKLQLCEERRGSAEQPFCSSAEGKAALERWRSLAPTYPPPQKKSLKKKKVRSATFFWTLKQKSPSYVIQELLWEQRGSHSLKFKNMATAWPGKAEGLHGRVQDLLSAGLGNFGLNAGPLEFWPVQAPCSSLQRGSVPPAAEIWLSFITTPKYR